MGLFDRWFKKKPEPDLPVVPPAGEPVFAPHARFMAPPTGEPVEPPDGAFTTPPTRESVGPRSTPPMAPPAPRPAPQPPGGGIQRISRTAQWVGPGGSAAFKGHSFPGGMVYIGRGLQAVDRSGTEPALIDLTLPVRANKPDHSGSTMGYWPSYDAITPEARAAYLSWQAGGRCAPNTHIGYVFLFFYGLERRALVDIPADPSQRWELPLIKAEVQRLDALYGVGTSFSGYASRFLAVLDLQMSHDDSEQPEPPPLIKEHRYEVPMGLTVEIGSFAADAHPIPADWALAWAWYHPEIHLRTPATRCPEEFATLFKARYTKAHKDGITVRPTKTLIEMNYYAASAGIQNVSLSVNVPDVIMSAVPKRQLAKVVDSVTEDLDPYSRFVGRNPDDRHSLSAAALLPEDLTGEPGPELAALLAWASRLSLSGEPTNGADVMSRWPTKSSERVAKPEAVALCQLLARHGYGLEPDVRFGGAAITPTTAVVIFDSGAQPPHAATPAYAAAATLVHLATAVSAADGHTSADEQAHLVAHLEKALSLGLGEQARLQAHMRFLIVNGVKLTGLKKRLEVLTVPQRESIGDLLISVAAADGVISPEEITSLTKIYRLMDLDPEQVHNRLHAHLTGTQPAPANGPVTVRPPGQPDPGYPITAPTQSTPAALSGFVLDLSSIEAKFAEAATVSALLSDIFTDDYPPPPHTTPEASLPPGDLIAGLDSPHSALTRALMDQDQWDRADFEALAASLGLLPEGALDRINEAAFDAVDEPFLEDDDSDVLTVNDYARQELHR